MGQKTIGVKTITVCATFSALLSAQAFAQPSLGAAPAGGLSALSGSLSGDIGSSSGSGDGFSQLSSMVAQDGSSPSAGEGGSSEQALPGLEAPSEGNAEAEPEHYRFDGGLTVRQETRGEEFTPGSGGLAEARNPSFFERHTVAEDHTSVRTCLAAGEVCQAEFDVIVATSEESNYDSAVLVNDEQVLPPPEDG